MEDFPGLLQKDFGIKSQGKSAPMMSAKRPPPEKSAWSASTNSLFDDHDDHFGGPPATASRRDPVAYNDVFGDLSKFPDQSASPELASILPGLNDQRKPSSMPVFDKPIYDDDIFEGVPGMRSSASGHFDDVFETVSSSTPNPSSPPQYDDLLGEFGRTENEPKKPVTQRKAKDLDFDDLIPGFRSRDSSAKQNREAKGKKHFQQPTVDKSTPSASDDPFVILEPKSTPTYSSGLFADSLEHLTVPSSSASTKDSSVNGRSFPENNAFDGFPQSVPLFSSEKDTSSSRVGQPGGSAQTTDVKEQSTWKFVDNIFNNNNIQRDNIKNKDSHDTLFDVPSHSSHSHEMGNKSGHFSGFSSFTSNVQSASSPKSVDNTEADDDIWLTVDDISLLTQPTNAPPPSRPPPPLPKSMPTSRSERSSSLATDSKRKANGHSSFASFSPPQTAPDSVQSLGSSQIDELEEFARANSQAYNDEGADGMVDSDENSAAASAAMKEAMLRAEEKIRQAKEARERERDVKGLKGRESLKPERTVEEREEQLRQEMFERERQEREKEEKEREIKRLERERELANEKERERTARIAVERATREARERAAAEARKRAERAAVERAAAEARERAAHEAKERAERAAAERVAAEARERAATDARERAAAEAKERATAEAKERAERAAAERVAAEARERAATDARERAAAEARERATAEARERSTAEARERASVEKAVAEARLRAERAAVEKAYAEARMRAAERAAAAAKEQHQKSENDLESFFTSTRPNSAPKQRTPSDNIFDAQIPSRGVSNATNRAPPTNPTTLRKASSTTNIVEDLSSIFGGAPSSADFQEIEGESEDRRKARMERHQRTLERAAKALAEKNERDMQIQKEQAERHRIAEQLDPEIKRWAAGKEGNLRALLSTLQYVLWPESGWQAVSLTDLITAASVKKVYRKATLCVHPDKVQQKGATIQQKYTAEKVFDLLKEAWNKFNSEELF